MSEHIPSNPQPRIGITQGDINGVSYEIILKAFSDSRMLGIATPVLYGQSKAFSYYKKNFGMDDLNYSLTRDARQAWQQKFNIINIVEQELKIEPGAPSALSAEMSVLSVKNAVTDLIDGNIDAVVLTPVCPAVDKGQPAFLSTVAGHSDLLRLLVSDRLRVGLVTDLIAPKEAFAALDTALVAAKIGTLAAALKSDFGINAPKIAVLGLDPSASGGNDVTAAAIAEARRKDIFAFGPFEPADLFASADWMKYDAVLAMYYEQGVVPFKLLSTDGEAYYWAGLPMICTGPLQGPSFSIANANMASPQSLRKAVYLALDILACRNGK